MIIRIYHILVFTSEKCMYNFYKHSVTHNLDGMGVGEDMVGALQRHTQKVDAEPGIEKKGYQCFFSYSDQFYIKISIKEKNKRVVKVPCV